MADAGKIVITPKGAYSSTKTYEWLDEVSYNGNAYVALKTVTGVTPSDDGVNWRLFMSSADVDANVLVPKFTEASTRSNIVSGENLSTMFGKIKKWFTDLKSHAFKDLVNNLTTETTGSALDASQGKILKDEVDGVNRKLSGIEEGAEATAATISGSNPTVTNSANAPLIYGKIKGYTLQDGEPTPDNPIDIKGLGDSGTIEVRTCGKNLLSHSLPSITEYGLTMKPNDDGSLTFTGTTTNPVTYFLDDIISRLKVGETYIWSGVTHVNIVEDGTNLYKGGSGSYTITENTTGFLPYFQWNSVGTTLNTTFYPMVRIKGTDDTYEPYTETVATIPIDTLYKGDYLEVYADGSGKIVSNNSVFTPTNVTLMHHDSSWADGVFRCEQTPSDIKAYSNTSDTTVITSTHFPNTKISDMLSNVVSNGVSILNKTIFFKHESIMTSDDLKTWFGENTVKVIYPLATPIETPLTAEQVEQFKQLYTFDNVTNFFCDGELTARYYCNTDSGDTVGMIQETVDGLQKTVKEIPDTYTTQSDFDRIVGGTVSDSGLTNVSYIVPNEISDGSMSFGSYTSGTLVDALRKATNQITMFLGTLFEEGDKSVVFENDSVAGTLEVFRHKLSEGTYLLDIKVTITSITETLSGNGPSVDLTLQDIGFEDNIIAIRESECLLASYYPLIVNGSSYCLGGGMVSTENSTKGFYLRFLPHKNTKGSISSNNKSVLSGTMMIKVVEQQL